MSFRLLSGDCRDALAKLPANSVHCCITSPPYFGLRDYKIPASIWGGDSACEHEWDQETRTIDNHNGSHGTFWYGGTNPILAAKGSRYSQTQSSLCCRCGAWRGVLGLEPSLALYVNHVVEVFRAVRRVLRPDATLWLNLGDSYATGTSVDRPPSHTAEHGHWTNPDIAHRVSGAEDGLKPKDLCMMPFRVALALQADGWWVRQDIVLNKPTAMPESVTDRCTKAHEYLFLLTRSGRYYYDAEAIKEPAVADHPSGNGYKREGRLSYRNPDGTPRGSNEQWNDVGGSRNKRSVWTIQSEPSPLPHTATFPTTLVEPCILAGTSEKGCCAKCGAPWVREVEVTPDSRPTDVTVGAGTKAVMCRRDGNGRNKVLRGDGGGGEFATKQKRTAGWSPGCACGAAVVPCTVLDPFLGTGTTAIVADRLQRDCIGIELSEDYLAMTRDRFGPLLVNIAGLGQ